MYHSMLISKVVEWWVAQLLCISGDSGFGSLPEDQISSLQHFRDFLSPTRQRRYSIFLRNHSRFTWQSSYSILLNTAKLQQLIYRFKITERIGTAVKVPNSLGPKYNWRLANRFDVFVIFLSHSRQVPAYYFETGHRHFLPVTPNSSIIPPYVIQCCIISVLDTAS
jgi:sRNA-binding regulator protein Hfq